MPSDIRGLPQRVHRVMRIGVTPSRRTRTLRRSNCNGCAPAMLSRYMQLPYGRCVGIMLLNRSGHVCVGQRLPECSKVAPPESWQMPQGAIAPAEPVRQAGLRVLAEDMNVIRVQVLAEAPGWFTYELPAHLIGIALNGQYCGQKQKWLAARFLGNDGEIAFGPRNGAAAWKWVPAADVPRLAPRLKRELYQDVVATFAPLLPEHSRPAPARPRATNAPQAAAELPWFVSLIG